MSASALTITFAATGALCLTGAARVFVRGRSQAPWGLRRSSTLLVASALELQSFIELSRATCLTT
jgi:hypothetical protein